MEDRSVRVSLESYLATHSADVRRALLSDDIDEAKPTSRAVAASTLGTPVAAWGFDESRVASGSADLWPGLVLSCHRHVYYIPVIAGGVVLATLTVWDMPRFWVPFRNHNYAALEVSARPALERFFGTSDYEWAWLDGGEWVIARHAGKTAGIMVSPPPRCFSRSQVRPWPRGVVTGGELRWWLSHPSGLE